MVKNPAANAGHAKDVCSIPGLGRSPGGGMATLSSILAWRIPKAWWATVHRIAKRQTLLKRLSMRVHTDNHRRCTNLYSHQQ